MGQVNGGLDFGTFLGLMSRLFPRKLWANTCIGYVRSVLGEGVNWEPMFEPYGME